MRPLLAILLLSIPLVFAQPAAEQPVPRTILALYDGTHEKDVRDTIIHQVAEMPLNHLGLVVRYWDVSTSLPSAAELKNVRGILTLFPGNMMADPASYLRWASNAIDSGLKFVVIGPFGAELDLQAKPAPEVLFQQFVSKLGLQHEGDWQRLTYGVRVAHKVPSMVEFERHIEAVLPPFAILRAKDPRARVYLQLEAAGPPPELADLVIVTSTGGYISGRYALRLDPETHRRQWFVNPFEFFRQAFNTDALPKPDATTLTGRRIYYSHVDGDGWRNVSDVPSYRDRRALSTEVVMNEVIRPFPDLPVTVGPIAADLDPSWFGNAETQRLARELFAMRQVEAGSHTYSHPLDWQFLERAPARPSSASSYALVRMAEQWWRSILQAVDPRAQAGGDSEYWNSDYERPRSYEKEPFDLSKEILGSAAYIRQFLPPGKPLGIIQWSGSTMPFAAAIRAARAAGLRNINGGDARFDGERLSYGWVSPIGRQVGAERQVYASNSNENTYTDLWTDRFFGFKHLPVTLDNTEKPIRIKPVNVYYHMYSGEKLPALRALQENLRFVRTQEIVPITTSAFAAIADGFYSSELIPLGKDRWRVLHRDGLQTIRFDPALGRTVDFARSHGVLGFRTHQDSLYVSLDPGVTEPVIALTSGPVANTRPYLVESRWPVWDLRVENPGFSFRASGFGAGQMTWKGLSGTYRVEMRSGGERVWSLDVASHNGVLTFAPPLEAVPPLSFELRPIGALRVKSQ